MVLWLLMASILSYAYKGTLLSTLTTIRYTEPLDTIDQMDASGIPFYVVKGTAVQWIAATDPRGSFKPLKNRSIAIPYNGGFEEKHLKEYELHSISVHKMSSYCSM